MYMGWQHDRPALVRGVTILSQNGPSLDDSGPPRNNMYYNYYGTQVLHHYGGYEWTKWNAAMRDYLIATQSKTGHEAGSWFFEGTDLGSNGRRSSLLHGHGHDDPRSLLPPFAPLHRSEHERQIQITRVRGAWMKCLGGETRAKLPATLRIRRRESVAVARPAANRVGSATGGELSGGAGGG